MKSNLLRAIFLLGPLLSMGQVNVTFNTNATTNVTQNDLVSTITGAGVYIVPGTVSTNCDKRAYGTFTDPTLSIGLSDGILLTTGKANNAPGPNDDDGSMDGFEYNTTYTDPDLTMIEALAENDVCLLEFDLVPICDTLKIDYVFGSEEYEEFIGTGFNDAFGFFISGPGIAGPYSNGGENIALVPGSAAVVSVDNINNTTNSAYYVSNPTGANTMEYDGYTTPLTAESPVIACETYHLKLIIADAGDWSWDAGVFLKLGGLSCPTTTYNINPIVTNMKEGCTNGSFEIERIGDVSDAISFTFESTGTATDGVDYNLPADFTLAVGQSTQTLSITTLTDALTEGTENFTLNAIYTICGFQDTLQLSFNIDDGPFADAGTDQSLCDLSSTLSGNYGGAASFYWSPITAGISINNVNNLSSGLSAASSGIYDIELVANDGGGCEDRDTVQFTFNATPVANAGNDQDLCATSTNLNGSVSGPGTYTWNSLDAGLTVSNSTNLTSAANASIDGSFNVELVANNAGCIDRDTVLITLNALPDVNAGTDISNCGLSTSLNGSLTGNGSILWSEATGDISFSNNSLVNTGITSVNEGIYEVIITADNNGCIDRDTVSVEINYQPTASFVVPTVNCFGDAVGFNFDGDAIGTTSYSWSFTNGSNPSSTSINPTGISFSTAGNNNVSLTVDNNGCSDNINFDVFSPSALQLDTTLSLPGCNDACDGAITVIASGATPGYQYNWNGTGLVANDSYSNLCEGDFSIDVEDANGCSDNLTFGFYGPGALVIDNYTSADVSCYGMTDGTIALNTTSSDNNYVVDWGFATNGSLSANGLSQGSYHVVVENGNNCKDSVDVVINEPNDLIISLNDSLSPLCNGNNNGYLDLSATGGNGSFNWELNGSPVVDGNLSGLGAGDYTVIVYDQNNCADTTNYSLYSPQALNLSIDSIWMVSCYESADGAVFMNGNGGTGSLSFDINGTNTSSPINNLSAGSYDITLTDQNGCQTNETVVITQPEALSVNYLAEESFCEDQSGNITLTVNGGTSPFQYVWSNGESSANINGLNAGIYNVDIIDGNNCSISESVEIADHGAINTNLSANYLEGFTSVDLVASVENPITNASYTWTSNGNTMTGTSIDTTFETPGLNVVYVASAYGNCADLDSIEILVNEDFGFEIPNVFTPNGDGFNDYFGVSTEQAHLLKNVTLEIYNRWGNLIFATNSSANIKWDGKTIGGADCSAGVYFFVMSFEDSYGRKQVIKSDLTLVR